MKRRKEVEKQLASVQAEKKATADAAAKVIEDNAKRSSELERELTALRSEMQTLGKNHHSSTGQGDLLLLCCAVLCCVTLLAVCR